jgi:hypothetical protein
LIKAVVAASVILAAAVTPAIPAYASLDYQPQMTSVGNRPYDDWPLLPRHSVGEVDSSGVAMHRVGGVLVDHPVRQAQYGLRLLNTYRLTHDSWFLTMAERQAQRLIDRKVVSRGAWWYPYPFSFVLGSGIGSTMVAPWYSGMAQGQALTLFLRLADATGDSGWDTAADHTFTALTLNYSAGEPWATWRDGSGELWLEEYPGLTTARSGRVLNGHMFAIFGVWEYWRARHSAAAATIFSEALHTVQAYALTRVRNPAWASSYSLTGLQPTEKYHVIHIGQLLEMHVLTGNRVFANDAEVFQQDFSAPLQNNVIRFAEGAHTGVQFDGTATGRVVARRTLRLSATSSAPIDQRRRIHGQPGYWYHVTAGGLAGLWVQEVPGVRATPGPVSVVDYVGSRTVQLAAGSVTAYSATGHRTIELNHSSSAPVSAFGWIGGRVAVRVSSGLLGNYWLPLSARADLA